VEAGVKHDRVTGYSDYVHPEPGLERSYAGVLCSHFSELVPDRSQAVVWMAVHLLEYEILDFLILLGLPDNTPLILVLMLPAMEKD
jgi:hypothetical protein